MSTKNTNNSIKTIQGRLPFKEVVVYPSQEQQRRATVRRTLAATAPNYDFSYADDLTSNQKYHINKMADANWFEKLINGYFRSPYNCINTATGWITNGKHTIARNQNLYDDPNKYGYKEVKYDELQPGDLIQYIMEGRPWHAGIVVDKGTKFKQGKQLHTFKVRSSNGYDSINPIRHYSLEQVGNENSDIEEMPKFYRYIYPNAGVKFIK